MPRKPIANQTVGIPKAGTDIVAAAFRTIHFQATRNDISDRWDTIRDGPNEQYPSAADLLDSAKKPTRSGSSPTTERSSVSSDQSSQTSSTTAPVPTGDTSPNAP